ncbi:MAG: YggS family pyridoxal phosphate-dependent enzyme [Fusobacteriales bacterium]|jgi:pyridoxal phosphate enzyme (YggS family)|nr:YggS family pyridoxal phosphate-dependent enzyme [Fusobacteriales bacterium]
MELNKDKIIENYSKIENDIKKYSPYPEKVKILFVTKYFDIEEHRRIVNMGFSYFGENKAQLFRDKIKTIDNPDLRWDFIGRLQKNKIKYIIKRVNLIHSIDAISLLEEVNEKACEIGRKVDVLIQVNVSHEETKTGFSVSDLSDIFKVRADNINIRGFMTMAPLTDDKSELRKYFRETFEAKNDINKKYNLNLDELSMGMSNDYKEALMEGATIVRIGSRLFE